MEYLPLEISALPLKAHTFETLTHLHVKDHMENPWENEEKQKDLDELSLPLAFAKNTHFSPSDSPVINWMHSSDPNRCYMT